MAAAALGASLLSVAGLAGTAASASAVEPTGTPECPQVAAPSELTVGQELTGSTVDRGSTPAPFTAKVVGVLSDGIAPGVDMVLVDVDSPAVRAAGGIWSGMSGSPLRTLDGDLVGAVSYGLSGGPSPIAGVTPAAAMYDLLQAPSSTAAATKVALPKAVQQRLVASGDASTQQTGAGMRSLPVPLAVSGLSSARLSSSTSELTKRVPGTRPFLAGAGGTTAAPSPLVPGGNVAFSLSHGQFAAAAVGTVTAVCADEVLAFGHPFQFAGRTRQAMHNAEALYVQPDSLGAPFKVANLGPVVGTGTQDRLAGVRGTQGAGPESVPVRSSVTSLDDGRTRTGTTHVVTPDFLPTAALYHALGSLDATADRIGGGVVRLGATVKGHRADGRPWSLQLSDVYGHPSGDSVVDAAFDVAWPLQEILDNTFEDVTVDDVALEGTVTDEYRSLRVSGLQYRAPNGRWATASPDRPVQLVAGTRAQLRVLLTPYRSTATVAVPLDVQVPAGTVGAYGELFLSGGGDGYSGDFAGEYLEDEGPQDFDELLDGLREVSRSDSVGAQLALETFPELCEDEECELESYDPSLEELGYVVTDGTARTTDIALGELSLEVEVVRPAPARAAVVDGNGWSVRTGLDTGAVTGFAFGRSTDQPLMGDWDGDGVRTPGVFRDGTWYLRDATTGKDRPSFQWASRGDVAVVGDWDGDGDDEPGVYRKGEWLLRGSASTGPVERRVVFGEASQLPVVGDWDGDGDDEPGTFTAGTWRLRSSLLPTASTVRFAYGTAGDLPVTGDWDRDGSEGIGVVRGRTWLLRDAAGPGAPDLDFAYGRPGFRPIVG